MHHIDKNDVKKNLRSFVNADHKFESIAMKLWQPEILLNVSQNQKFRNWKLETRIRDPETRIWKPECGREDLEAKKQ